MNSQVEKIEPVQTGAFANDRQFAITLSSNHAKRATAYSQYFWVIQRLPSGVFDFVREKSKNGKYHIHGILSLASPFDYKVLMDAKTTEKDLQYDIHIWYKKLETLDDYKKYSSYSCKHSDKWESCNTSPSTQRVGPPPSGPIPEITIIRYAKPVSVPGRLATPT